MKYNHQKIRDLVVNSKPRKLTNKALADEIGISLASLDKIKDGKNEPSIEALVKIATYFKKDANYFFDFDSGEKENLVKEETVPYHKNLDWKEMYKDCKKELEKVHELLDMFKSGKITVNDSNKLDSKKCG